MSDDFRAVEKRGWAQKADGYDDHLAKVTHQSTGPILSMAGEINGARLLDIGCATGDLVAAAAKRGARAIGADFSPEMVAVARGKFPELDFQVGDAEALSFDDNSFDIVTCAFSLWHVGDPDLALAEAFRVLRPGGVYVYTAWLPAEEGWQMMEILTAAITAHGSFDVGLPPAPPPYRFSEEQSAAAGLTQAGFEHTRFCRQNAVWQGQSGDDLLDLIEKSIVRAPMIMNAQTPDNRLKIRAEIVQQAEGLRRNGVIAMGWPYLVGAGRKPG